jgi:hypothetical protein
MPVENDPLLSQANESNTGSVLRTNIRRDTEYWRPFYTYQPLPCGNRQDPSHCAQYYTQYFICFVRDFHPKLPITFRFVCPGIVGKLLKIDSQSVGCKTVFSHQKYIT